VQRLCGSLKWHEQKTTDGNLRCAEVGGAYQWKVEPHTDILSLLSQLTELNEKLSMLDFDKGEKKQLSYVL
jgi:hypothetical protein